MTCRKSGLNVHRNPARVDSRSAGFRRLVAAAGTLVVAAALTAPATTQSTQSAPPAGRIRSLSAAGSLKLLSRMVSAYAGRLGPYRRGIWRTPSTICWACNQGGPATSAATLYMLTGRSRPNLLAEAEGTIDTAIRTRQLADGAFVQPRGGTESPDVATMFFGEEEGNTYLELAPVLGPARRARWQASLAAAAWFLIHNGNLNWYTSGNINLGNAELFYLAWRATGNPAFDLAFEQAWGFALGPPQARWPGRGLIIVKAPKRADGSDGAGYLTETGAGGTGYDTEYTELQLDVASRLYLLSGDPRVLRLANLLVNTLLRRISSRFTLNTSGGTRHTKPNRVVPVITSSFAVLALDGGRSDLLRDVIPQLHEVEAAYREPSNDYGAVYRRALGNDVSVIALATHLARPVGWGVSRAPWSGAKGTAARARAAGNGARGAATSGRNAAPCRTNPALGHAI